MERIKVSLTTAANGSVTGYATPTVYGGFLQAIRYVPDGTAPFDTGVDFAITEAATGQAILTVSNAGTVAVTYYPRAATVTVLNAASLYAVDGAAVNTLIPVFGQIQIAVTNGGDTKVGVLYVYIG